ncbi:MAG: MGMT family protein [Candidatus Magasanikbacteria bacterium]|nr:MGMT family protein [Candidatus Magasanikbacteria bacterium]
MVLRKRQQLFGERVLKIIKRIPTGKTLSYSKVARRTGNPGAARAVGNILNKNYDPAIPCHRVIRADGKLGGYNRGVAQKKKLLRKEGALPNKII